MLVTFSCSHCFKAHDRAIDFEGTEDELVRHLRRLQEDVSTTCDCHDLSSVDDIVAVRAVKYAHGRYIMEASLSNGGVTHEHVSSYALMDRVPEAKRPPSFKKINAYLATPDGLRWFKCNYLKIHEERDAKDARENIEYAIRRMCLKELEELLKIPLVKEKSKPCRLSNRVTKYGVKLTAKRSLEASKK